MEHDYDIGINVVVPMLGFPGEELFMCLLGNGTSTSIDLEGTSGDYQVEALLARPEHLQERNQFNVPSDRLQGNSYIQLAKAKIDRKPRDLHQAILDTSIGKAVILPNDDGFAGLINFESVHAESFLHAEELASRTLAPLLSGWSMYLDTPIQIEMIRVTELSTARVFYRTRAEFWPVWLGPRGSKKLPCPDFVHYTGVYREALNSNSPAYRFLGLFKILESIGARRSRLAHEAKRDGKWNSPSYKEKIPNGPEYFEEFLRTIYPYEWIKRWDTISLNQIFLSEALGKSVQQVIDSNLRPIRDRIGHALMDDGELGFGFNSFQELQPIRRWLPLLRCLARLRLCNEFPDDFQFQMQENK